MCGSVCFSKLRIPKWAGVSRHEAGQDGLAKADKLWRVAGSIKVTT
jgi:hypothetical protein